MTCDVDKKVRVEDEIVSWKIKALSDFKGLLWNAYVLTVGLVLSLKSHRRTGLMFIKSIARLAIIVIS